jgi:hypothetical protein
MYSCTPYNRWVPGTEFLKKSHFLTLPAWKIAFQASSIFNVKCVPRPVPRDVASIVRDIHEALEIPLEEADLYVRALTEGRCLPDDAKAKSIADSLSARGMLILEAGGSAYLAVHPRMAMSNLFRAYEERLTRKRKEKRLLVDKLTLELIPLLPGETKGTNASALGGASTATR